MRVILICGLLILSMTLYGHGGPPSHSPLDDVVLVIDPGHGDRAVNSVPADPGAQAQCEGREASECVFTWDTAMRLRQMALARGAQVFLTLESPDADYLPHSWNPDSFPEAGSAEFPFRKLVDFPEPVSVSQALESRVATANRIYRQFGGTKRVYFFSLHFDSTNPDLSGVSYYYPLGTGLSPEVLELSRAIRAAGRERRSLLLDREWNLASEHAYSVLSRSENPNAFLIELANIRSLDFKGANPDLWRMRSPEVREEYAAMILDAVERFPAARPWHTPLVFACLMGLALLVRQLKF